MDALQLVLLLLVALAPPVILSIRLRNAERRRREPWRVLWQAFAWGALGAATLSILAESAAERTWGPARAWGFSLTIVLLAPFIEEVTKALGLRWIRDRDPEPEDGYIYGGAAGLGFAATENALYILSAALFAGEEHAFATALYRGIATVALHGAASAFAGYGLWQARYAGKLAPAFTGVGLAVALHVAYNAVSAFGTGWAALVAAAMAVVAYLLMMRRVAVLDAQDDAR